MIWHSLLGTSSLFHNILFKFADDTNLLVPENCEVYLQDEFAHVQDWASQKKMIISRKLKRLFFIGLILADFTFSLVFLI
jgi:hypothetical protein